MAGKKKETEINPGTDINVALELFVARCDVLEEKCQELHDIIVELAHYTGQQRPILKRGWKALDPNEKQYLKGAKTVAMKAPKSWEWK
jgi:hypothetical protein